jgi:hypothetical protein
MHREREPNGTQETSIREQLRAEIEGTCGDFHLLLSVTPDEMLDLPSANPGWTIREVLYHMSLAPRNLPADVSMIKHLRWVPKLPPGPFDRLNAYLTRRGARGLDKPALAEKYDQANAKALHALETVRDDQWQLGVEYPNWDPMLSGFVTLERLFHYIALHFQVHAEEIKTVLEEQQYRGVPQ